MKTNNTTISSQTCSADARAAHPLSDASRVIEPATSNPNSLRNQLRNIQKMNPNDPGRISALESLLAKAQMREADRATVRSNSPAPPTLPTRFKHLFSKCRNKYHFGTYAPTPLIAQRFALSELAKMNASLTQHQAITSVQTNGLMPAETNDQSTEYFSCHSSLSNETINEPTVGQRNQCKSKITDIATLKSLVFERINALTGAAPTAKSAAIEALDYILFPFESTETTPGHSPALTSWHSETNTLTLQSDRPYIGHIVRSSRVPLDFALNNTVTISIAEEDTGAITLHFDGPSFFNIRLTPDAAKTLCNSYNLAARAAGLQAKTMLGLECSASSQLSALTFTPQGTVSLQEEPLISADWSSQYQAEATRKVEQLFAQALPQAKQAEYFAGSAWTIACLKASAGSFQVDDDGFDNAHAPQNYPQAKSAHLLKILRPQSLNIPDRPGRIQWAPLLDHRSIKDHIRAVDNAWSQKGKPGEILKQKSGRVLLSCETK